MKYKIKITSSGKLLVDNNNKDLIIEANNEIKVMKMLKNRNVLTKFNISKNYFFEPYSIIKIKEQ